VRDIGIRVMTPNGTSSEVSLLKALALEGEGFERAAFAKLRNGILG
jgi:hypothetical protein